MVRHWFDRVMTIVRVGGLCYNPPPKVHSIELNIKSTNLLHVCIHVDAAGQQAHYCFIEEGKPVVSEGQRFMEMNESTLG